MQSGFINGLKMLIYSHVNCAFSSIYALSRTHLRDFNKLFRDHSTLLSVYDFVAMCIKHSLTAIAYVFRPVSVLNRRTKTPKIRLQRI